MAENSKRIRLGDVKVLAESVSSLYSASLWLIVLCSVFLQSSTQAARRCEVALTLMGAGESSEDPGLRERILQQLAMLYTQVLTTKPERHRVFKERVTELAEREGVPLRVIIDELEARMMGRASARQEAEAREERKQEEQKYLYSGLEPYLQGLTQADRNEVEENLLKPRLVKPLITGEVEFRFQGRHEFAIGREGMYGHNEGKMGTDFFDRGQDFAIGQVPVTQLPYALAGLYDKKGRDPTPSRFKTGPESVTLYLNGQNRVINPNYPVETVDSNEADAHAERVSELTGSRYGLLTEKQWEFAARAESASTWYFGDDEALLPEHAWLYTNSGKQTHAVGEKRPNDFGLYELYGNVWEWTSSQDGSGRVIRGGGWADDAPYLRSAFRGYYGPGSRDGGLGFRLERTGPSYTEPSYTFTLGGAAPGAKPGARSASILKKLSDWAFRRNRP